MHNLEPFTYYRNPKEQRTFLLVDCPTKLTPEAPVVLIEWGKTREQPVRLTLNAFTGFVESGLMQLFTPKFQ